MSGDGLAIEGGEMKCAEGGVNWRRRNFAGKDANAKDATCHRREFSRILKCKTLVIKIKSLPHCIHLLRSPFHHNTIVGHS